MVVWPHTCNNQCEGDTVKQTTNEQSAGQGRKSTFPKLFWAGVLLFTTNIVVAAFIVVSPNLTVTMYGAELAETTSPTDKPSPFMQRVSDKPVKVKVATRVMPIIFEQPIQTFEMPRSTQRDLSKPAVYKYEAPSSATQLDLPRVTAAARIGSVDATPRRVSERELKQIVVN